MSHDSLVADLTQLTERGGVYDTKAIARYQQSEESSFLEYIYKKALVQNSRSSEELYFELLVPDYPTLASVAMEMILLPRIPDVAPKKLEELKVCQSIIVSEKNKFVHFIVCLFARRGVVFVRLWSVWGVMMLLWQYYKSYTGETIGNKKEKEKEVCDRCMYQCVMCDPHFSHTPTQRGLPSH